MITPQPGTGCQTQNPQFTNPAQNNFELLSNSTSIQSGLDGYDLGACFYNDIPAAPQYFDISNSGNESLQINLSWINPVMTVHGNPLDSISTIMIWRNDILIAEIQNDPTADTLNYSDLVERPDYYRYQLCVKDSNGVMGQKLYTNEMWMGGSISGIVIWELDSTPITSLEIKNALTDMGYDDFVYISPAASRYPLESSVDAVFVCLGVYSNNHILTDDEGQKLASYLNNGGRLYMEGGDTWFFDPQTAVHPFFEINPLADGGSDLLHVSGEAGTVYSSMYFDYSGENSWIDQIDATANSTKILSNADLNVGIGVAYDAGNYKTIGTSFEFGGLVDGLDPSAKSELLKRYLDFFDITIISSIEPGDKSEIIPEKFVVSQNYPNPFNNSTVFEASIPENGELQFGIFDITGKKVYDKNIGKVTGTRHKFHWNGLTNKGVELASGIYFYRFIFVDQNSKRYTQTKKMMLLR